MSIKKKPTILESMGLAGTAAVFIINFTHPLDVYKTRLQAGNFNFFNMIKKEGIFSLWKGIQPAYFREITYTSTKLGFYAPIKELIGANNADASFFKKFAAGSASGTLGTLIGNPFDVMKTLGITNTEKKVSFPNLAKGIYNQQGINGFYRGISANIGRACIMSGTKMSCYDEIKGHVVNYTGWKRKDIKCQAVSSFGAGFIMTCTSLPFDMVRTTLMNQPIDKKLYNGFLDASVKIFKNHGPLGFYKGFIPMWGRIAPITILQLVIYDNLLNYFGFHTL